MKKTSEQKLLYKERQEKHLKLERALMKVMADIFGVYTTNNLNLDKDLKSFIVEVKGTEFGETLENVFTFEKLNSISEMFGTKKINFGVEDRDDGYCDTCSSPYNVVVFRVGDITKGIETLI